MNKQKMKFFTYTIFIIYILFFIFYFFIFGLGWAKSSPAYILVAGLSSAPQGAGLGPANPAWSLAQASDRLGKQLMHA